MTKENFIKLVGLEAYKEVQDWGKELDEVFVYESLEDIEEDYNIKLDDVEDVFQYFGSCVRVVADTGDFLIERCFIN